MRERLEQIRRAIARQDQQLVTAHAQLGPRDVVTLPAAVLQSLALLCAPPDRQAGASPPTEWNALRC